MKKFSKHVALDVHKETIAVEVADAGGGQARFFGEIANTPEALAKLARQLKKGGERLAWCYEAGPCGYVIYRQLSGLGEHCVVVAPSLIPKKAGDRVKTDRRDALSLARLDRAGELTAVWVPDAAPPSPCRSARNSISPSPRPRSRCRRAAWAACASASRAPA